jgi:G8 domain
MNVYFITLNALLLSFALTADAATLRGSESIDGKAISTLPSRQLQGDGMKDFVPLACNANIASASCSSWSSKFGTASSYSNRLTIPCGECVTMDLAGSSLYLLGGLDVLGKLVFPDGYMLNLQATIIAVQGELVMTASKPVDGAPQVKITMIGNDDTMTFTPIDVNANACPGTSTCAAGKKAIVVAGGKVTRK